MKTLLPLHLAAMLALAPLMPAQAAQQTMSAGPFFGGDAAYRTDQQLQKGDQNFSELYARVGDVPLTYGCGWYPGEGSASSASGAAQQGAVRRLCYIPHGASFIKLMFGNTGATTSGEADPPTGLTINIGVETGVPAPWSAGPAYATGATVTFGASQYTALTANTGVQPSVASTSTWQSTPITLGNGKPVTCGGVRNCGLALQATASGTNVAPGFFVTDPFPVNVPASGGWIAIDMFTNQPAVAGAVNTINTGPTTNALNGEYANFQTSISDLSVSGSFPLAAYIASDFAPIVIGQPATPTPTVCLYTDSIGAGVQDSGLVAISSFTANGTGFVATDMGRLGVVSSVNNPATIVNTNATVAITGVTGGQVTSLTLIYPGSYTTAVSTGPYTVSFPGSAGSSVTIAGMGIGTAHDIQGPYGTQGSLQRALADNGIPFVPFSKSGDLLASYQTRDYTRLAATRASGCSTAIIELSVNDQTAGAPAATILSRAQALATQLKGTGLIKSVIMTTMTPTGVTSTDGFATQTGQSPNAGAQAIRAAYNNAIRAVPSWANGTIDSAAAVETVPDTGYWKTDGVTVGLYTIAGLHPSQTGHALKEIGEAQQIKALIASGAIR